MEPNSIVLVVMLVAAAATLLWVLVRFAHLLVRIVAGTLALVLAAAAGMAIVNDYYGYYQTWGQLSQDLSGSYASYATTVVRRSGIDAGAGRVVSVTLPGARSGITRSALVYLPPQYFEKQYAHMRFPVVELVHGSPGSPSAWLVHLDAAAIATQLINSHRMGPEVLVMPTMYTGHHWQECVDAPGALDDTYITRDVRTAIETRFRVSRVPAQWGIAGYSSGGYCAADLAMRHRGAFGAAGIMDGYFRPQDGPAAQALHFDATAEAANDPLQLAARLGRDASPLPSFWIAAGTGDAQDYHGALAFAAALHGVEQLKLIREPGAGHNFYAWQAALPRMLAWMWTQLASPQQRVRFPVAGRVTDTTVIAHRPSKPDLRTFADRAHRGELARGVAHRPKG